MRRFFLGLLAVLLSLGVASCGGGGGYDGETGPNNSLRMSPLLSDVGLSVGYVAKVARITQGVEPYYVSSSDPSVSAQMLEDGTLVVRGNAPGTSTVSVQDSSVSQKVISVKVEVKSKALSTSVGTALTLSAGESRTFTVTGGMAPYTVSSNNNSIVSVASQMGGVITITGRSNGTAALLITDDIGATLEMAITVNAPDFSVSPGTATGQVGTEMVFTILGGVGPYSAVSSAPSVATIQVAGDIARAQLRTQGTSTLTFRDSTGKSFVVTLTSTQTLPPLSLSPTSGSGQVGTNLVFTAIGGAGPFTASSSNPSVASVSVSGSAVNVSLQAAGSSTITVLDSKGQNASVTVTATGQAALPLRVTPPSGSGQVGSNMVLVISGGTGPYSAVSSNPSFVTSTVSGSQIVIGFAAAGASTITVIDSAGASVSVPMTATSNVPALTVNPPTAIGQVGTSMSLSIAGGVAPYSAATSNPLVASAAVNGNTIQVTFSGEGSTNLTVLDANLQSVVVPLQATYNALPLAASPESATGRVGYTVVFTLVGGVGPYTAVSSNPDIASPSVNGSTVTVTLLSVSDPAMGGPGPATITIRDSRGETTTVTAIAEGEIAPAPGTFAVTPQNQSVSQHSTGSLTYALPSPGGPYVASLAVGDEAIASASISGSTLTIGVGSSGNRCVGFGTRVVQVLVTDNASGRTGTAFETIIGDGATCP